TNRWTRGSIACFASAFIEFTVVAGARPRQLNRSAANKRRGRLSLKTIRSCCLLALVVPFAVSSVLGQSVKGISGVFVQKGREHSRKPQTRLMLFVQTEGNVVSGTYTVDYVIKGIPQGQGDILRTPFGGRLKGRRARIEFDSSTTFRGPDQGVVYKHP